MSNTSCLVAVDSTTLNAIYTDALSKCGFTVHSVTTGLEALSILHAVHPAVAIVSTDLSDISGYTVCRIIKKTDATRHTQVVLCNVEDTSTTQYWAENNNADGFYVPEHGNIQALVDMVTSLVEEAEELPEELEKQNELALQDVFMETVNAMDTDLFDLMLVRNAWLATGSFSIEELVARMSQDIRGIVPFDVLGVVLYDATLTQYYQRSSRLSDDEFRDFMQVCRTDAEAKALGISKFNWEQSKVEQSVF